MSIPAQYSRDATSVTRSMHAISSTTCSELQRMVLEYQHFDYLEKGPPIALTTRKIRSHRPQNATIAFGQVRSRPSSVNAFQSLARINPILHSTITAFFHKARKVPPHHLIIINRTDPANILVRPQNERTALLRINTILLVCVPMAFMVRLIIYKQLRLIES